MSIKPSPNVLRLGSVAATLAFSVQAGLAQTAPTTPGANAAKVSSPTDASNPDMAPITVKAERAPGLTPGNVSSTTKGGTRLLEAPQSITVLTRELLDSRQDKSLVEALGGVAGVVAGERGRRGFDDFGIRGQAFGQEKFIDGLNTVRSGYVPAEEIFGAERIEVLKGPASLLFGNVRPGGLVNIVSKRPLYQPATKITAMAGSYESYRVEMDTSNFFDADRRFGYRLVGVRGDTEGVVNDRPQKGDGLLALAG